MSSKEIVMDQIVVGMFNTLNEAQHVVKDLQSAGFKRDEISLVANDANKSYSKYLGNDKSAHTDDDVTAGEGASFGAAVGALTGALVGLGALAIPGVGPVLAAGPLAAALGGGAVGAVTGAATGGVVAGLVKTGIPEDQAQYYAEGVRRGGTLVTVNTDDKMAQKAADIMNRHGAMDVDQRAQEWKKSGWKGFDTNAKPYSGEEINKFRSSSTQQQTSNMSSNMNKGQNETVLPVVEEELQVGKREVQTGGVRAYSRVVETPVEEQVRLREEHVNVERRPVDRPVNDADKAFKETSVEMRETAERAVVQKQARVIEEVVIGKQANERTETVRDTVRRTEVQVENMGQGQQSNTSNFDMYNKDFQTHWKTNFGDRGYTYEQYSPAYRYGYSLGSDKTYTDWNKSESQIRQNWEQKNPGTWEDFKDAIRHAWDKVRNSASNAAQGR